MGERKTFTTTIDVDIWKAFKIACVTNDVNMNDVMEHVMKAYTAGSSIIDVSSFQKPKK